MADWTYSQLQAAIAALGSSTTDPAAIAETLNAQTQQTPSDVKVSEIEKVLVPTGELFVLTQEAAKPLSGTTPPTAADQVIAAAWNFTRMLDRWVAIETSNPIIWPACQAAMSVLQTAGILSAQSINAISALQLPSAPMWQPVVTAGHVQTAMAQV